MSSAKDQTFRVKLITIHNIMGIQDGKIEPGALTLIRGKNGVGKTSNIEAIRAALGKGATKANLLREGETEGEVVVILDDGKGPPYLRVTATVNEDGVKRSIGYPGQPSLKRGADFLSDIRNEFALFPTSFFTMDRDKRLEMFLSAVPLTVGKEDLGLVLSLCRNARTIDLDRHAFKVLSDIEKALYEQRKELNAVVINNRKTMLTMREALPAEAFNGELAATQLASAKDEMEALLRKEHSEEKRIADIHTASVDAAKAQYQEDLDRINETKTFAIQAAIEAMNASMREMRSNFAAEQQSISTALATAESNHNAWIRASEARAHMERLDTEANEKAAESEVLTNAMNVDLVDLRTALLEQIPIERVSVQDGDIFVETPDGLRVPFDAANTAERIRIVCDLALLKAGPLKLIVMDGAEALDAEHLALLRQAMEERGANCIASQVTEDPEMNITK